MTLRLRTKAFALFFAFFAPLTSGAFAQQKARSKPDAGPRPALNRAAIARGSALFHDRCEICHFSNSEAQKLGPGLKGIYPRGKFANGKLVTDAAMEKWIANGSPIMPAYSKILTSAQIHDLIAYIRTL